jgi:hypothetical protein
MQIFLNEYTFDFATTFSWHCIWQLTTHCDAWTLLIEMRIYGSQ